MKAMNRPNSPIDKEKNVSREARSSVNKENKAAFEEFIENDPKLQGGNVSLKATNEPLGRPQKDGEESENT